MKYGITWTNDEESVCQTGYFTTDINEARQVGRQGLVLGGLLISGQKAAQFNIGKVIYYLQVDGMNNADAPQDIKYAVIQTGEEDGMDDLECITLGDQQEAVTVWTNL